MTPGLKPIRVHPDDLENLESLKAQLENAEDDVSRLATKREELDREFVQACRKRDTRRKEYHAFAQAMSVIRAAVEEGMAN